MDKNCYGNDASCASGTCGENYCCNADAVNAGCTRCVSGSGDCSLQVNAGETCSSDDDCYDRGSCLGVCCSRSDITNCLTCGATKTDSLYGTTFYYCTECEAGYETYNYMGMTGEVHCRKSCEEGEFFPWASSDSCTALYTDGQNCYGNDASCASGTCGENYCCGTAQMSSVFEEFSMCCTLCSDTGACLAQADCQQHPPPSASNTTNVTSPPPPNAPAEPTPSQPSPPPPPNRLIFGGDYESSASRYSVVTALVVSIINLYMTTKSR